MINQWPFRPFTTEFTPFSLPPSALPWFPSRHSTGSGHYPRASEGTTPLLRGGDLPRKKKSGDAWGWFRDVDIDHLIPAHHQGPIPHWRRNWLRTSRSSRSRNWALEETRNSRDWSKNLQETMVFTRKKNLRPVRITFFSREEATCQRFFGNLWDILIILIS